MHYNKLVRDNIPDQLDAKGIEYEKRIANDAEFRDELFKKLNEEIAEFNEAIEMGDQAKITEELTDIIEVINAIKTLPGFENTESVRQQKLADKGGFEKRIILKGEK